MPPLDQQSYSIKVIHGLELVKSTQHNVDVEVHFEDGSRFGATFFTLRNIQAIFAKNKETGECAAGLYLWAADMILVSDYSAEIFAETVRDLLATGEFTGAFSRFESESCSDIL